MAAPVYLMNFEQDIAFPITIRHGGMILFTGDNLADTVSVSILENGAAHAISGTVTMNCIRADGATVAVTGSVSGNTASATLTQACVAIPGPLAVVMKITSDSTTTTLLKVIYTVDIGVTGTAVDPGTIIPDINALISAVETAIGSIPADYSGLLAAIAPSFNPEASTPYPAGSYVWYPGLSNDPGALYKFTAAHSGSWTGSDVEAVVFGNEITNLKNANPALIPLTFTLTQNKMIDGTDGEERDSNSSRYASNAVDVENLTKIHLYSAFRNNYGAAFYDANNVFISGVIYAEGYNEQPYLYSLDVPAGAKYFRFTVYNVNMSADDVYLGIPSTHNDFKNYIFALNSNNKSAFSLPFTLTNQKMIEGTTGNEYSASTSYSASNPVDVEGLTKVSLYSAFSNNYGCAFYDADGVYISGAVAASGYNLQPYYYNLDVPSTAKYFRFTVVSVNMTADRATLKVPTAQTDIVNSIKALKKSKVSNDAPITDLSVYIKNNLATKDIGPLSKGYILLFFDDGANTLATGTIPLLIENNVPGSFGLLPQSKIFAAGNEGYLATVVDAVENHGCVVAMHGSAQWPTYTESVLSAYFDSTAALFADKGLGGTYGAICPGGQGADTSVLVKALAGGYFGYVFSGNRADKISYDSANADGKYNGARSNRFDLDRCSGIGITSAKAETIVSYAAENHLLLCPFWHDNTLNDENHPEYITYFNDLISAAKDAGLTFITTKDLPNIT